MDIVLFAIFVFGFVGWLAYEAKNAPTYPPSKELPRKDD